jgi:hypothetical protein
VSDPVERWVTGTDPLGADSDGDGIRDGDEDTDGDGLPDGWEARFGLGVREADAQLDPDGDGLCSAAEWLAGRNPLVAGTAEVASGRIALRVLTPLD